ncbi:MAG: VWA domain-containing protein [Spirochaetes bacterium]|nr:VWA domain-containing protein [Spirochaetota bacterium]
MSFDSPWAFILLLAPVAAEWLWRRERTGRPAFSLSRWNGPDFVQGSARRTFAATARNALAAMGFVLLVMAAAGPSRVERSVLFLARGADIVFALDASPSMGAKDLRPDRFGAASMIIGRFTEEERNEAVGIVAFGSEAVLVCPPTTDYAVVRSRLAQVVPGELGDGTAVGTGLAVAVRHAASSRGGEKRVVLVTDGENNAGAIAPEAAAALALENGIAVTVIGVGSRGEVPVEYADPETGERFGGTYLSAFDEDRLRALAASTGGSYMNAADDAGVERAFAGLSSSVPVAERRRQASRRVSAAPAWFAAACALLFAGWLVERVFLGSLS